MLSGSNSVAGAGVQPQQQVETNELHLFYVAGHTAQADDERTTNVLTVANIQEMAKLEDRISAHPAWPSVCLRLAGQGSCAPARSAVPYLRNATDAASLRAALDRMYAALNATNDLGAQRAYFSAYPPTRPPARPPACSSSCPRVSPSSARPPFPYHFVWSVLRVRFLPLRLQAWTGRGSSSRRGPTRAKTPTSCARRSCWAVR